MRLPRIVESLIAGLVVALIVGGVEMVLMRLVFP